MSSLELNCKDITNFSFSLQLLTAGTQNHWILFCTIDLAILLLVQWRLSFYYHQKDWILEQKLGYSMEVLSWYLSLERIKKLISYISEGGLRGWPLVYAFAWNLQEALFLLTLQKGIRYSANQRKGRKEMKQKESMRKKSKGEK